MSADMEGTPGTLTITNSSLFIEQSKISLV